jgi:hypothetical protein
MGLFHKGQTEETQRPKCGAELVSPVVSELRLPGQAPAPFRALRCMAPHDDASRRMPRRGTADEFLIPQIYCPNS